MSRWSRAVILMAALIVLGLAPPLVSAGATHPGVIPPNAAATYPHGEGATRPFGKTYGQWSADWWVWALSVPQADSPLYDTTGAKCAVGQTSRVWFLAGIARAPGAPAGPVTRACAVPSGTPLFVPIINSAGLGDPNDPADTEEVLRTIARNGQDQVDPASLFLAIDGREVETLDAYRVQSPRFDVTTPGAVPVFGLPPDFTLFGYGDGRFVMLDPLPVGEHTIQFRAARGSFSLDVTYHLTVVPRGQYGR